MLEDDMNKKKAIYISKNNNINQEFFFVDISTKIVINDIYNGSWFGSNVFDLTGPDAVKIESCFNRSVKIMMDLPYGTHRGLIEPLTGKIHLRKVLWKRFFTMIMKIRQSKKKIVRVLLAEIENDVRSNTGRNLRRIMNLTGKNIGEIMTSDIDNIPYFGMGVDEEWRILYINHLLDE